MAAPHFDYSFITERAKTIILQPKKAWKKISTQQMSVKKMVVFYLLPMAVIAAVIQLLTIWLGTYLSFGFALKQAAVELILPIATVTASAIIINELAENFNSTKDITSAFKLIVFSYTPWLLANIIANISGLLSWVIIFSLYGIYLLWLGIPVLMDTPDDKKPVFALVTVAVVWFLNLILAALLNIGRLG